MPLFSLFFCSTGTPFRSKSIMLRAGKSESGFSVGTGRTRQTSAKRCNRRRLACSLERMEERLVMTVYPTTTILVESLSSAAIGTNVTFTATVSSTNGVPTGSVMFEDGSTLLGSGTLSGGVAGFSTSSLAIGSHHLIAVYSGAGSYFASASAGITASSIISTTVGNGTGGYTGDGGPATSAEINYAEGVAFDASGDMFIADTVNNVVRKVTPSGIISTVAGDGTAGYTGDGGSATSAELTGPSSVALDASGDLFIVDPANEVIRKVTPSGVISTYAGNGTPGASGDGGPATSAELHDPQAVAVDALGDVFIADSSNNKIRMVSPSGIITTVAGNGGFGYTGDGGPATDAELSVPSSVCVDASGDLFIADSGNNVAREVNTLGVISTFAGNGTAGYSGDGGPAASAELHDPYGIACDAFGNVYIADYDNRAVREVNPSGVISTFAGNGAYNYTGDGGPAGASTLDSPTDVAISPAGNIAIADNGNTVIRGVAPTSNVALTFTVTATPANISLAVNATPQSTTFQAVVDTASGSPVNGGTASFYDGTTLLGVVPVVNGMAVFVGTALSPGTHNLSAVFSGTEAAGAGSAFQVVTIASATTGSPSLTGLSRYPVHDNRTLVSLFFDQALNPAEALWKHNYKLHTSSGGNVKISHVYFDPSSNTVTLLPGHRLALRNTYNLKLLGLNSKSSSKGTSPTVTSSGWLATTFKAKINHKALSVPGAPPAITFVNGQETSTRG